MFMEVTNRTFNERWRGLFFHKNIVVFIHYFIGCIAIKKLLSNYTAEHTFVRPAYCFEIFNRERWSKHDCTESLHVDSDITAKSNVKPQQSISI